MGQTLILTKKMTPQERALENKKKPKPTLILNKKKPQKVNPYNLV
jgi:hypothetical protein